MYGTIFLTFYSFFLSVQSDYPEIPRYRRRIYQANSAEEENDDSGSDPITTLSGNSSRTTTCKQKKNGIVLSRPKKGLKTQEPMNKSIEQNLVVKATPSSPSCLRFTGS